MNTLIKLAEIANFADRCGQHNLANQSKQLIREAQFFDAVRTLFDPGYSGLDRDSGYWKRLQRGWSRGKMDRGVGLLLAINAERTKLNKKIETLTAPLKDFQTQVSTFYDKLRAGADDLKANNFRDELRDLQNGLKSTLKLVSNKDLKHALRLREKLQEQQLKALDKIKGLDDETKDYLAGVLKGEQPTAPVKNDVPGAVVTPGTPSPNKEKISDLRAWLKTLDIPRKGMTSGTQSYRGLFAFKNFMQDYNYNPLAIVEYFDAKPDLEQEGFERFGDVFGEMLAQAHQKISWDARKAKEQGEPLKTKVEEVKKELPKVMTEDLSATLPPPSIKEKEVLMTSILKQEEERARQEALNKQKLQEKIEREKDLERMQLEVLQQKEREAQKGKLRTKHLAEPPVATTPGVVPTKTSNKIDRQITRLGRLRKLKKISHDHIKCNCENKFCDEQALDHKPGDCQGYGDEKYQIQGLGPFCYECYYRMPKEYREKPQDTTEKKNGFILMREDIEDLVGDGIIYDTQRQAYDDGVKTFGSMNGLRVVPVIYTGHKDNPRSLEIEDRDIFDTEPRKYELVPDVIDDAPEGRERYDDNKEYDTEKMMLDEFHMNQEPEMDGSESELVEDIKSKERLRLRLKKEYELIKNIDPNKAEKIYEQVRTLGNQIEVLEDEYLDTEQIAELKRYRGK